MQIAQPRELRRTYGFDEVSIVPGEVTVDPSQTNTAFSIGGLDLNIPLLAASMDAVVSPEFAVQFDKAGGMAVMNLEGVQCRYEDPEGC